MRWASSSAAVVLVRGSNWMVAPEEVREATNRLATRLMMLNTGLGSRRMAGVSGM